jgi:hypothetical protein
MPGAVDEQPHSVVFRRLVQPRRRIDGQNWERQDTPVQLTIQPDRLAARSQDAWPWAGTE